MSEKRRDKKGRILHNGEIQMSDGRYSFKYVDENGNEIVAGIWQNRTTNVTEEVFRSSVTCDKINFRRQLL